MPQQQPPLLMLPFGGPFLGTFFRLDVSTIFKVRKWERFQFMIDYEAQQVQLFERADLSAYILADTLDISSTSKFWSGPFQTL